MNEQILMNEAIANTTAAFEKVIQHMLAGKSGLAVSVMRIGPAIAAMFGPPNSIMRQDFTAFMAAAEKEFEIAQMLNDGNCGEQE